MEFLNCTKLENVNWFKEDLKSSITMLSNLNPSIYDTEQFKLLKEIVANFDMDMSYLSICYNTPLQYIDTNGIYRNLRNSIEACYDLYNLCVNSNYISVLKYNSSYASTNEQEDLILKENYFKFKDKKLKNFTIKNKANIAISNGFPMDLQTILINISRECSSYSHPDVYRYHTMNIVQEIEYLLRCECIVFVYASKIYNKYLNNTNGTQYYLNEEQKFNYLQECNSKLPSFYVI